MTDVEVRVSPEDIQALAAGLLRGAVYTTEFLHDRYRRNREAAGRPVASVKGFGRALAGQGWQSKRIRKSRGPRSSRTQTEKSGWLYPGGTKRDDEISVAVRTLGHGHHRTADVRDRYLDYCSEHGFEPVSEQAFPRALTERGFYHTRIKGVDYRYVFVSPRRQADEIIADRAWPAYRQVDITSNPNHVWKQTP